MKIFVLVNRDRASAKLPSIALQMQINNYAPSSPSPRSKDDPQKHLRAVFPLHAEAFGKWALGSLFFFGGKGITSFLVAD